MPLDYRKYFTQHDVFLADASTSLLGMSSCALYKVAHSWANPVSSGDLRHQQSAPPALRANSCVKKNCPEEDCATPRRKPDHA